MCSSSSVRFIDAALAATGDKALSYTHHTLKWLIRKDLLALLNDFPTLSPGSDAFTHDDGTAVHLLHAHGVLLVSSSVPPILVTIWLHQAYPFTAPLVYVFPANSNQIIVHDHPFVEPSGATAPPYLREWQYPKSNLSDLARNLVKVFRFCHPYCALKTMTPSCNGASLASKREAIDRLVAGLHYDAKQFRAQIEEDIVRLCSRQSVLRDRDRMIDSGLRELEQERLRLKKVLEEKVNDADVLSSWLQLNGVTCLSLDELEGFEAVDERGRCLLENEAAVRAIDDAVDVLDEALAEGTINFGAYIKQVRSWAREQFFHRALVIKIEQYSGSLSW